ncbi:uncharacterized protein ca isoform X2 [Macrobrachium rosenbergii]
MVGSIYEVVRLVGGLRGNHFTTATTSTAPREITAALATSGAEIIIFDHRDGVSSTKKIPWTADENRKPVALAFSPTAEWLLVASEDGTLFVVPLGKRLEPGISRDHQFKTDDVMVFPPNGSRARPTSLVWWQTLVGDASLAIIGTELGELSFIELSTGKEVGGTYITVPVKELHLCRDNSLDTIYLLITGPEDRQWRLVLEQRSSQYLFPLEHITPEWPDDESPGGSLHRSGPPPRSRLLGLKQLSVEKLQMLRQRLAEAKTGSRRKPLTENKGVDTCDIDELSSTTTPEQAMTTSTTSIASGGEVEVAPPVSARPERLCKYIHDVIATPQYAKERYLLAGHCKPNTTLMVYSTDLEPTPLYVFKIIPDVEKVVLQDEMIFLSDSISRRRITIISTFFSSSKKIDGTAGSKVNPVIQEIDMPEDEEIITMFPSPPLVLSSDNSSSHSGRSSVIGRSGREEEEEEEVELPTHTWPHGCMILTTEALYICQPRNSVESLFMDLVLRAGDIDGANKLGVIFSLDPKLFELAADVKLRSRNFSTAIALYKHSRCPHVKCSVKFAGQGMVNEFLTYMGTLTSGVSGPDLGVDERRNLANLAIICHLHHLCLPVSHKPPQQQQALRNLLLFLRDNQYYDEVLALTLAAGAWRWETLQYLAASRGLYVEKLRVLLASQVSPVLDSLRIDQVIGVGSESGILPLAREREAGYLHCVSDPELRQVLLSKPSLARMHIALVLGLLATLEIPVVRRLADLYNPSHPAIRPFLQTTNGKKQTFPPLSSMVHNSSLHSFGSDELLSVEAFVEVFLAIVIQLNRKRGWKYNPDLLTHKVECGKEVVPVPVDKVRCRVLSCGYGHTSVIIGSTTYTWGIPDYGVLGHGPRSTTNHRLYAGINVSVPEEVEPVINGTVGHMMGGTTPLVPLISNRVPQSFVNDGSEPRNISYFNHMKVLSIACGKNHMLAITDNGVYGWGSNKYGQVGVGGTGRFPRPTLVCSLDGKGIISIGCGQFHSLGVSEDGKLYTWGWGVHGQLGNGSVEDCLVPTLVKKLSKERVVLAEGGYAHSVAMTAAGNIYAWGCGTYGQVGNGGIVKVTSPVRVCLPGPATHLTAGYFHNIAVTRDHKVYTWGINPACLRVQAQLQRRGRMMQQAAEGEKRSSEGKNEGEDSQAKESDVEKSGEASEVAASDSESDDSIINDGANDNPKIVVSKEDNGSPCGGATQRTTVDDSDDTIMTLPEEEDTKDIGAKSFIISPEPSPEKASSVDDRKCDIFEDTVCDRVVSGNNSSSTNCQSSNSSETLSEQASSSCQVSENSSSTSFGPRTVSANTVPSCDPSDLGHLLPQEVEMPCGFGAVRSVACGSQHSVLLTTHGSLYTWGRNMSGQLGTGNRREVLTPSRVLDEAYITDIACGADFTLALESQGQLWGWGSNYYSQLGRSSTAEEEKGQAGRVFMLRTTKRVLKVPHSVHSNCESPRIISGLPPHPNPPPHHFSMSGNQDVKSAAGAHWWLSQIRLETMDSSTSSKDGSSADDVDDGLFGDRTLHTALSFFHNSYNTKNIASMLQEAEAHQALATLYTLERQYSQAMHHQLCALFKQSNIPHKNSLQENEDAANHDKNKMSNGEKEALELEKQSLSIDKSVVGEAVRIMDHYLRLQTEESQTGMKHVLQEGISLWLSHALPLAQLEDLLLTHLPRTVYPLALLLFGDGNTNDGNESSDQTTGVASEDPAVRVLSQLSTKFCLNLCSSVINHLQAGGVGGEYVEALSQVIGAPSGNDSNPSSKAPAVSEEQSQLDAAVDILVNKAPDAINLNQDEIQKLQREDSATNLKKEKRHSVSSGSKLKSGKTSKENDKDCVLFTCGHHFTEKEFKTKVLPQMETSVMTVPGLLGKTARVLLDQYHSDQPEMACPHCVLAHLTIKLTKHKQT